MKELKSLAKTVGFKIDNYGITYDRYGKPGNLFLILKK
jgi:hypothetical protein